MSIESFTEIFKFLFQKFEDAVFYNKRRTHSPESLRKDIEFLGAKDPQFCEIFLDEYKELTLKKLVGKRIALKRIHGLVWFKRQHCLFWPTTILLLPYLNWEDEQHPRLEVTRTDKKRQMFVSVAWLTLIAFGFGYYSLAIHAGRHGVPGDWVTPLMYGATGTYAIIMSFVLYKQNVIPYRLAKVMLRKGCRAPTPTA